jgi:hypothetical protein
MELQWGLGLGLGHDITGRLRANQCGEAKRSDKRVDSSDSDGVVHGREQRQLTQGRDAAGNIDCTRPAKHGEGDGLGGPGEGEAVKHRAVRKSRKVGSSILDLVPWD